MFSPASTSLAKNGTLQLKQWRLTDKKEPKLFLSFLVGGQMKESEREPLLIRLFFFCFGHFLAAS